MYQVYARKIGVHAIMKHWKGNMYMVHLFTKPEDNIPAAIITFVKHTSRIGKHEFYHESWSHLKRNILL